MHLGLRISDDLAVRLDQAAKESGQSKSDFVRSAIEAKLRPKLQPKKKKIVFKL